MEHFDLNLPKPDANPICKDEPFDIIMSPAQYDEYHRGEGPLYRILNGDYDRRRGMEALR